MKTTNAEKQLAGTARKDRAPGESVLPVLDKLPGVPRDYHLDTEAKRWYRLLGKMLLETNRLTKLDIPNLVLLASNWAQWAWANRAINEKNAEEMGTGYVQTFKNNTTNITTEYKVRSDAEEAIMKVSKLFGMSFKDRHQIQAFFEDSSGQLDMMDALFSSHPDHLRKVD